MNRYLKLANAKGRDAVIGFRGVRAPAPPTLGLPDITLTFRRYLIASDQTTDAAIQRAHGDDYAQALIDGDPEVDLERVGQTIEQTMQVYVDAEGAVLQAEPQMVELLLNPDGTERERRAPVDAPANINGEIPVRWSGRKIPIQDAVRRFAFRRTVQLQHVDGLTYDFLHAMATELERDGVVMLLGSGEKGTGPLMLQANGRAYRGFLSGETRGEAYRLLLHLSDLELKRPAESPATT
jgi:hypothetical protein